MQNCWSDPRSYWQPESPVPARVWLTQRYRGRDEFRTVIWAGEIDGVINGGSEGAWLAGEFAAVEDGGRPVQSPKRYERRLALGQINRCEIDGAEVDPYQWVGVRAVWPRDRPADLERRAAGVALPEIPIALMWAGQHMATAAWYDVKVCSVSHRYEHLGVRLYGKAVRRPQPGVKAWSGQKGFYQKDIRVACDPITGEVVEDLWGWALSWASNPNQNA